MMASTETRVAVVIHVDDFAFAAGDRLHDVAQVFVRHFDVKIFDRLEERAVRRRAEK